MSCKKEFAYGDRVTWMTLPCRGTPGRRLRGDIVQLLEPGEVYFSEEFLNMMSEREIKDMTGRFIHPSKKEKSALILVHERDHMALHWVVLDRLQLL